MPPRPPLSASSSVSPGEGARQPGRASYGSSRRQSIDLVPISTSSGGVTYTYVANEVLDGEEYYPIKSDRSSYDEAGNTRTTVYPPSLSDMTKEEARNSAYLYPDYGGAGTHTATKPGLFNSRSAYVGGRTVLQPEESTSKAAGNSNVRAYYVLAAVLHISSRLYSLTVRQVTGKIGACLASFKLFRQLVYICVFGLILWIPGLVGLIIYGASSSNKYSRPAVFQVGLFWWSVWLSSSWVGLWVCGLIASLGPSLLQRILGVAAIPLKSYFVYAAATRRYITLLLWTLLTWVVYLSTVMLQFPGHAAVASSGALNPLAPSPNSTTPSTAASNQTISIPGFPDAMQIQVPRSYATADTESNAGWLVSISRFMYGLVLCAAILLAEKILIQSIALSFHKTTYSDRIQMSDFHITVLTTLASHAPSIMKPLGAAGRSKEGITHKLGMPSSSTIAARAQRFKSERGMAKARRTDFAGALEDSLYSPTSPFSMRAQVESALEHTSQSRSLAKHLFEAFAKSNDLATGLPIIKESDIAPFFKSTTIAHQAYVSLDRDNNEGCTLEEFGASVLEMHRERLCLLASLHDVDLAVLKLDNIFMSFYAFVGCIVIAALLSSRVSTLVASLGTIILGLSWLIGSTAQEALSSIVWVFGKHPIDVGDCIDLPGLLVSENATSPREERFIVEEVQLLSTVLRTMTGKHVQVGNYILSQKPIINVRRSGPMEEKFSIKVEYTTTLEQIEQLRERMLNWIGTQGRDFLPGLDIELDSLDDQSALALTLDVRYKSNWQDDHLRARRRNRWVMTLKSLMEQLQIFGPDGDPSKSRCDAHHGCASDAGQAKIAAPRESKNTRMPVHSQHYTLMDQKDESQDRLFSEPATDHSQVNYDAPSPFILPSRLNDDIAASPRRHAPPTTHASPFNVRGRRGDDEHVGDLEKGS